MVIFTVTFLAIYAFVFWLLRMIYIHLRKYLIPYIMKKLEKQGFYEKVLRHFDRYAMAYIVILISAMVAWIWLVTLFLLS